jgi:pimeloyl-ACP methyl ester carboxylesterase
MSGNTGFQAALSAAPSRPRLVPPAAEPLKELTVNDRQMPLQPLSTARTAVLDIAYYETGPGNGTPVILLHGFPYDIHSYEDVAPALAASGFRVIVPYLRGHGATRIRRPTAARTGQQAALGQDVLDLMDALRIPTAVLAGFDWGGRAACVAAAMWPERVRGIVSVNGYLIQDIARSVKPLAPEREAGFWYFYYFLTERGRRGLESDSRGIAGVIWRRNSPLWAFEDSTLDRAAEAFQNPDFVDVVVHSYRHRLGYAEGAPEYANLEKRLAAVPPITVPAIALDGLADGNFPPMDTPHAAEHFTGPFEHRLITGAGHNLPQESPAAFVDAIQTVAARAARTMTI